MDHSILEAIDIALRWDIFCAAEGLCRSLMPYLMLLCPFGDKNPEDSLAIYIKLI